MTTEPLATSRDIAEIRGDITKMKADIAVMKSDIADLKADNRLVKWMIGFLLAINGGIFVSLLSGGLGG